MSTPVFVCAAVADAAVGSVLVLTGAEAHHAGAVQRRVAGEAIDLIDGTGRRANCVILTVREGRIEAIVEAMSIDGDPEITLVQALAKGGRDEHAVEAAVELGITSVIPWAADRSIVQWRGVKADKALAQWRSLCVAAAKQSRRAKVPEVKPLVTTRQLAVQVRASVASGIRVLVLHEGAATKLTALTWLNGTQPVWIVVGPEGGISDTEIDALTAAGGEPVLLGPHVLRASTAGPASIAALAAARGTWG